MVVTASVFLFVLAADMGCRMTQRKPKEEGFNLPHNDLKIRTFKYLKEQEMSYINHQYLSLSNSYQLKILSSVFTITIHSKNTKLNTWKRKGKKKIQVPCPTLSLWVKS